MSKFFLPQNSKVVKGKEFNVEEKHNINTLEIRIYMYDPDENSNPRIDSFYLKKDDCGSMVLDILQKIKGEYDTTLAYRRSCREGVCGSCAMNINGVNTLACIKPIADIGNVITIYPLPHKEVIKDLVVVMTKFYDQLASVQPWLKASSSSIINGKERIQSESERLKLDGITDCVLCECCSSSCPSYWWNPDKFLGPAVLLQAYRWIADNRDDATQERLDFLESKVHGCNSILNCTNTCPKGLNPSKAIAEIRSALVARSI